jgi:hypothetical protein
VLCGLEPLSVVVESGAKPAEIDKTSVHHLSECQLFLQRLTVRSDSARETGGFSLVSVTVYLCSCHHG